MQIKHIVVGSMLLLFVSCGGNKKTADMTVTGIKEIRYSTISVDTVNVTELENSSYSGFSGVDNGVFYFFDEFFSYYYPVSIDGRAGKHQMGLGRGPGEIPIRSSSAVTVRNNNLLALGSTDDAYLVSDLKKTERLPLSRTGDMTSYDASTAYTVFAEVNMSMNDKAFFFNVVGNNENVDPVFRPDYYEKAHPIMRVDFETGEEIPVGRYPRYYIDNRNRLKHMVMVYFDLNGPESRDGFTVTYQADSVIYTYDRNFNLLSRYGFAGVNMNTNYENPSPTEEQFGRALQIDLVDKGYYYWIKNVPETGLTFRTYQKGSHTDRDGLQIYKDQTLIADVEVPRQFRVVGYVAPYYVTQILCDDYEETMKFYRFKLE